VSAPEERERARTSDRARASAERAKERAARERARAEAWVGEAAHRQTALDLAIALRDRDRQAFASVLGSALAVRLFLFTVALIVALVTGIQLLFGSGILDPTFEGVGVTGEVTEEISSATAASTGRSLSLFLSSVVVALLAGRSLTVVLAACSAGAWRMDARAAKASVQVVARVTALVSMVVLAAALLNRLRASFGLAVATSSLALNVVILAAGWFFVTLSLPRETRDPGSVLPGAVLFGIALTAVQWFMHFYLPRSIDNASETMGSLGVTIASLSYLFIIGRLMAGSVVVNAVVFERFGSISPIVFRLPGVQVLPRRFPKLVAFFDLPTDGPTSSAPDGAPPETPADDARR
jgi:hypothetical protein